MTYSIFDDRSALHHTYDHSDFSIRNPVDTIDHPTIYVGSFLETPNLIFQLLCLGLIGLFLLGLIQHTLR